MFLPVSVREADTFGYNMGPLKSLSIILNKYIIFITIILSSRGFRKVAYKFTTMPRDDGL